MSPQIAPRDPRLRGKSLSRARLRRPRNLESFRQLRMVFHGLLETGVFFESPKLRYLAIGQGDNFYD
jgi:hypothetical protein